MKEALFSSTADFSGITICNRMKMPKTGQHTVIELREERNGKYFKIDNRFFMVMILCIFSASKTETLHSARETQNIWRQSSFPVLCSVSPQG